MIRAKHKKAFSMLTAIVVIVAMSVIAMYVMSTAGKSIKMSTDQYRKEQAMLYAKSYTEYTIMAVSADARAGNCLEDINANIDGGIGTQNNPNTGYRIRVRLSYIGDNLQTANCAPLRVLSNAVEAAIPVANRQNQLNIIVDAYVDYRDLNSRDNGAGGNVMNKILTYHRRSLQKI